MENLSFWVWTFSIVGFLIAAYSIVANDAIQTLGTFLSSNAQRPWWVLWAYASSIIVAVMLTGYFFYDTDIAFDRLNSIPYPENGVQWYHAVPPIFLLILTRYGIPVSTTFLVLTIFALTGGDSTDGVLPSMLQKSALGYLVAIGAAFFVYLIVSRMFERWISNTKGQPINPLWYVLQWCSTAFLWWQWLVQDLANIFVFLPRTTTPNGEGGVDVTFDPILLVFATVVMLVLHAYIFKTRGGEIQKIVLTKTNTTDVRAATLVDFIYGLILMYFKELNDIPMSTTWVFLGLLAGRELAISLAAKLRGIKDAAFDVTTDIIRAFIGLVISVVMALGLPFLATGELPNIGEALGFAQAETTVQDVEQVELTDTRADAR